MTIGPFSFAPGLLLACLALLATLGTGHAAALRTKVRAEPLLWICMGAALLAARAAFVLRYRAAYAEAPLQVLDIRDGCFAPAFGVGVGLLLGGWLAWCRPVERKAVLAGVLAGSLAWFCGTALLAAFQDRQALPRLDLARLDGTPVALASLSGRPLVINLWASWCPPCRREMPVLDQARRRYPGVDFVFVNQGESAREVENYLKSEGLALGQVLLDRTNRLGHATGSPGLPTTLFFDAQGRLVERRMGELSSGSLAQGLEALSDAQAISRNGPAAGRPSYPEARLQPGPN
jgi:thiol-disulfide isomerase/thioredoxin